MSYPQPTVACMSPARAETTKLRFAYRLRVSRTARVALLRQWDACRWVWNKCVEQSKTAHRDGVECGQARLDRMLTGWRTELRWLREGSSVPQQQTIRDFAKSRTKALLDVKNKVAVKRRAGMPRFKKRSLAAREKEGLAPGAIPTHDGPTLSRHGQASI